MSFEGLPYEISGLKLDAMSGPTLSSNGPGRADSGNFVLTGITVKANGKPVTLGSARSDFCQDKFDVQQALVGDPKSGWAIAPWTGQSHQLYIAFATPIPSNAKLDVILDFSSGFDRHVLGRFRIAVTEAFDPLSDGIPIDVRYALRARNPDSKQEAAMKAYFLTSSPILGAMKVAIASDRARIDQIQAQAPVALVMEEKPATGPLTAWVRHRGEFLSKTEQVTAGPPSVLPPIRNPKANRLDLAKWLVSKSNPLTARVEINRTGSSISVVASSKPARISAARGSRRHIPSFWTGWPASSWQAVGT